MKQITIKSADLIIDDTQVGLDVDRLNRVAAAREIDIWPGREEALAILKWAYFLTDDEYAEIKEAPDDSIAGALIREKFRTTLEQYLYDVYAVIEEGEDR